MMVESLTVDIRIGNLPKDEFNNALNAYYISSVLLQYSCRFNSNFLSQVLFDIGVVSTKEPFQCVINQGIILGEVI